MTASLSVLSWNLWFGGTEIDDSHRKQLEVLREHLVPREQPVLLLQEAGRAAHRIADALGWNVLSAVDTAIVTPLPLSPVPLTGAGYDCGALLQTVSGEVLAWSAHLDHRDYGPYFVAAGHAHRVPSLMGEQLRSEQAARIIATTEAVVSRSARDGSPLPVVIGGDFNAPATGDWAGQRAHAWSVREGLRWACTDDLIAAGFTDAFRAAWPDPERVPGHTWSVIEPAGTGPGAEPRDRIDFVFSRGLEVREAHHLGNRGDGSGAELIEVAGVSEPIPGHRGNAWPSDHLGVLAELG